MIRYIKLKNDFEIRKNDRNLLENDIKVSNNDNMIMK